MNRKKALAWALCAILTVQGVFLGGGTVFAASPAASAAHVNYAASTDSIQKNYGKGNYLNDTVTITGTGMGQDVVLSVKQIEDLACADSSIGYSDTYSFRKSGGEYYSNTMTGARLYQLLLHYGMSSSLPDDTVVTVIAKDGNSIDLTLAALRYPEHYYYYTSASATDPSGTNLPVMLSFASNGVPLVGPTGDDATTKVFSTAEGYVSGANNSGGPLMLTVGQESANDYNAHLNNKWISRIVIGSAEDHSRHSGTAANTQVLTVNVIDSSTSTELKSKTYTVGDIETFASAASANKARNYYGDGSNFYEGARIWKLLANDVILPSNEGSAVFQFKDGSTETVDLAYLRNAGDDYSHYITAASGSDGQITCVKPIFAYAKNGQATAGNNLVAALPIDGTYKTGYSLKECTGINVYLGIAADLHNAAPYSSYKDQSISFTGTGIDKACDMTVEELEESLDLAYKRSYSVGGTATSFGGIDLYGILDQIGLAVDAETITLKNASGSSISVSMSAITAGSSLLAYSKNGKALVPAATDSGYDAAAGNAGGPILFVDSSHYFENITSIEVKASGANWSHSQSGYTSYLSSTIRIHGSEAAKDVTITLADLENMTASIVRDSFASGGGKFNFEGVILKNIINKYMASGLSRPTAVSVVAADGYKQAVDVGEIYDGIDSSYQPGEHRDVILAYSIDGVPLVTTSTSIGYNGANAYGPLRLIVENQISDWVKNVSGIVIGTDTGIPYTVNYYQTKARSANDDVQVPGLGYSTKAFTSSGAAGSNVTVTVPQAAGWVCSSYEDSDGNIHTIDGSAPVITLSSDASKNNITLRYNRNAGFLICGDSLTNDYWYPYATLQSMAKKAEDFSYVNQSGSYYKTKLYSVMKRGGVPSNMFGSGIDITDFLNSIGGTGTPKITFYAADGGSTEFSEGPFNFSSGKLANAGGYYYFPDLLLNAGSGTETGKQNVLPLLSFRTDDISWKYSSVDKLGAPTAGATVTYKPTLAGDVVPVQTAIAGGTADIDSWESSPAYPYPVLMVGQTSISDYNNTNFTKMIHAVIAGTDDSSLAVQENGSAVKTYSTLTFLKNGLESIPSSTNEPEGIAADRLLGLAGETLSSGETLSFYNGSALVLSIDAASAGTVYIAPDADATTHVLDKDTPFDLVYKANGTTAEAAVTKINLTTSAGGSGSSAGTGGGGGGSGIVVPKVELSGISSGETTAETGTANILKTTGSIEGTLSGSKAGSIVSVSAFNDLVAKAKADTAAASQSVKSIIEINQTVAADQKQGTLKTEVAIPVSGVSSILSDTKSELKINTVVAGITFDQDALKKIADTAQGSTLSISAEKLTSSDNAAAEKLIGEGRPVFDFSVISGNTKITSFAGNVSVSVPYTLAAGEKTDGVVIYYIADDGTVSPVKGASYDTATGLVTFTTNHFSNYAIGYDKAAVWANPFADISDTAWYYGSVKKVYKAGLFSGTSAKAFGPGTSMTRAMFVSVINRLAGGKTATVSTKSFSDVSDSAWYGKSVAWAVENGIVSGTGSSTFSPDQPVSREQIAVFLYRYAVSAGYDKNISASASLKTFSDSGNVSEWASDALTWAVDKGLINGMGDSSLDPNGKATRAQVASMIERFAELFAPETFGETTTGSAITTNETTSGKYETVPDDDQYLTLKGSGLSKTLYFTLDDLKGLKQYTVVYTGRNKENKNARQYLSFTGVNLATLLNLAGWKGTAKTMQVNCSDGYTRRYDLDEIMEQMVSFQEENDGEGHWVPAMVALVSSSKNYDPTEGAPFRLVFGQEPTDTDDTMSFNMQGWASYLKTIEIY